jgi:hypothetical protein
MRAAAGFNPDWLGSYFLNQFLATPPESLRGLVFPALGFWRAIHQYPDRTTNNAQPNKAAYQFLELLKWLCDVFLQDAPFLQAAFPILPIWEDLLFSHPDYQIFSQMVREITAQAETNNYLAVIHKAVPAIANKLRSVATAQASYHNSLLAVVKIQVISRLKEVISNNRLIKRKLDQLQQPWTMTVQPPRFVPNSNGEDLSSAANLTLQPEVIPHNSPLPAANSE